MLPILKNVIKQREDILYNVSSQESALINNIAKTYSGYKIIDLQPQDYIEFNSTQNTHILITYPDHPDSIFLLILNNTNIQIKLVKDAGVEKPHILLQELRSTSSEIEKINKNDIINITQLNDNIQIDTLQKNNKYISLILGKLNINISDHFKSVDVSDLPTQYFEENISLLTDLNNTNINLAIKKNKNATFDSSSIVKKGTIKILNHIGKEGDISLNAVYDCQDEMCQPIKINYGESGFKDNNSPPRLATTIFGVPVDHTSVSMNVNPINFSTAKFLVKSVAFVGIANVGIMTILSIDYSVKEEASGKSIHTLNNTKQYLDSNIQDYNNIFDLQNDDVSRMFYCKGFILDNIPLDIYYNSLCVYDKNNRITEIPVHHIEYGIPSEKINDTDILKMHPIYTTLNLKDFAQSLTNRNCIILDIDTNRVYQYNNMIEDLNLYIPNLNYENRDNVSKNIILDLSDSCLGAFGVKSLVNILSKYQSIALLDLSNNYIGPLGVESLCDILSIQNVQILDMSHNYLGDKRLKKLINCLVDNIHLRLLKLSSNKITNEGLSVIDKILRNNDYINVINLAYNNINSIDKIVDALKENIALTKLELSGNTFDIKQSDIINFYLQQNKFINDITFGTDSFRNNDKREMAKVLKGVSSSNTLTIINHHDLKERNIHTIAEVIIDNNYVKALNLSSNFMYNNHVKIIAQTLSYNHFLKILDISKNNITNEGICSIIDALKENIALTKLELSGNAFDIKQSDIINFYLQQNKFINDITFGTDSFRNNDKREMAKVLKGVSSSNTLTIINHHDLKGRNIQNIAEVIIYNNYVKALNLSSNFMDNNHVKIIAQTLSYNHFLKILDISKNNITNEGICSIIDALKENIALTKLELSGNTFDIKQSDIINFYLQQNKFVNDITFGTDSFKNDDKREMAKVLKGVSSSNTLKITNHADLKERNIQNIAEVIIDNNYVKALNLSSNFMDNNHVKIIAQTLSYNNLLKILDISKNNITNEGIYAIIDALKENIALTKLELSGNTFDIKQSDIINFYLQQNKFVNDITFGTDSFSYIEKLEIARVLKGLSSSNTLKITNHADLKERNIKNIADALKDNTFITRLILHSNGINSEGIAIINDALENHNTITVLDLSLNHIGSDGTKIIANILKNKNTIIIELDLSFNKIGDDGAKAIADALKDNTSITRLIVSYNDITDQGIVEFSNGLKNNNAITELDLSFNKIGDNGAKAIADALKDNTSITRLILSYNNINAQGTVELSNGLKNNNAITELDLSFNKIGDDGAKAIADALKDNTSITRLGLSSNSINSKDIATIAYALKNNNAITELDLSFNKIGDNGAKAIADALKDNTSITSLILSYNNINAQGIVALEDALKINIYLMNLELSTNPPDQYDYSVINFYLKQNKFVSRITSGIASINHDEKMAIAQMLKMHSNTLTICNHNFLLLENINAIADVLKNNADIIELNLSFNNIGNDGAKIITEALKDNTYIKKLNLSYNKIDNYGANTIVELIKFNNSIIELNLSFNNIGDDGAKAITDVLKNYNTTIEVDLSFNNISNNLLEYLHHNVNISGDILKLY